MTDTFDNKQMIEPFGLKDVDMGFFAWWNETLDMHTTDQDNHKKKIPVVFWSSERWLRSREEGLARDDNGQIVAPIISISRTLIEDDTTGHLARRFADTQQEHTIYKKVDPKSSRVANLLKERAYRFDPNSPIYEVYTVPVPDHYKLTYDVTIWAPYMEDINKFIEKIGKQLNWKSKKTFAFDVKNGFYMVAHKIESIDDDSNLDDFTKEERILRKSYTFEVSAHIIPESDERVSPMKRYFSQTRLVIKESIPTQEELNRLFKK